MPFYVYITLISLTKKVALHRLVNGMGGWVNVNKAFALTGDGGECKSLNNIHF